MEYYGKDTLALDAKNRMAVPIRHRAALLAECAGRLMVTEHPDGHLLMFPWPKWQNFAAQFADMPMTAQWLKRIFLGSAVECELDSSGRIVLNQDLRSAADITRDIKLVANGTHFEIWQLAAYEAMHSKDKNQASRATKTQALDLSVVKDVRI